MRNDKFLNWGTYSITTVLEHRAHGTKPITLDTFSDLLELMHSWGFALRKGVFAETKEGICRNKDKKRAS